MRGLVQDIERLAVGNHDFRRVLYTAEHGTGEAILDGVRAAIRAGFAIVVPAGATHNIINTGKATLKLYTLYAPPNHRDGIVHHTREDAEADNEHFDGKTSE